MTQDELAYSAAFGDASDFVDVGLQSGHPFEIEPGEAVAFEVVEIRHLVDEDVGASGECDQVVIHRGVAGKHHRSVCAVETVGQGGVGVPVAHGTVVTRTIPSSKTVMGSRAVPSAGAGTSMSIARTR